MVHSAATFISDLRSLLSEVESKCQEFHQNRPNWYSYEHTVSAEFYHLLREKEYEFDEIDVEKFAGRHPIDLVYGSDKDNPLVAVQFITYRVGLQKGQFDDVDALRNLPPNVERVLVLVRMDKHVRTNDEYVQRTEAEIVEIEKAGILVVRS